MDKFLKIFILLRPLIENDSHEGLRRMSLNGDAVNIQADNPPKPARAITSLFQGRRRMHIGATAMPVVLFSIILALIAGALFAVTSRATFAQDSSKEEESLFVAKKAFEDGFYEVSLGLLERFLNNYPDSPKATEANLLIGECYFHQNRFLEALNKFEGLLNLPSAK